MEIMIHNRYTDEFKIALERDIRNGLEYNDILVKYKFGEVNTGLRQLFSKLKRKVTLGKEVKVINTASLAEVKSKQEQSREQIASLDIDKGVDSNSNITERESSDVKESIKKQDVSEQSQPVEHNVEEVIQEQSQSVEPSVEEVTQDESTKEQSTTHIFEELGRSAVKTSSQVNTEPMRVEPIMSATRLQNTMSTISMNPILDSMLLLEQNNLSSLEQTLAIKKAEIEYLKECVEHKKQYIVKLRSFIV